MARWPDSQTQTMSQQANQNTPAEPIDSQDDHGQPTTDETESDQHSVPTPAAPEPEPELPLDTVFELLRNDRRRRVLEYLDENEGEATLSELAERIAAIENDTTEEALSSQQRKRVYVGLYQCHLPKMDGAGVIEFDENRGDVERLPAADQLHPYLEAAREDTYTLGKIPVVYLLIGLLYGGSYLGGRLVYSVPAVFDVIVGTMILCTTAIAAVALVQD